MNLKFLLQVSLALVSVFVAGAALAGDPARGEGLAATCAACHGPAGQSTVDTNPKLAGQYESYLVQALKSYKSGDRQNPIMRGFAAALSAQDIADLAAYFSSQPGDLATAAIP